MKAAHSVDRSDPSTMSISAHPLSKSAHPLSSSVPSPEQICAPLSSSVPGGEQFCTRGVSSSVPLRRTTEENQEDRTNLENLGDNHQRKTTEEPQRSPTDRVRKLVLRKSRKGTPAYVKLPVALFPYGGLTTDEKWLWMLLLDRQGQRDDTRYGQTALGEFLGWSRHKAGRHLRSLSRKEWISLKELPGGNFSINARPGLYKLQAYVADLQKQDQTLKTAEVVTGQQKTAEDFIAKHGAL